MISKRDIDKTFDIIKTNKGCNIKNWKEAAIFHTLNKSEYSEDYCNDIAIQMIKEDRMFNLPFEKCILIDDQISSDTGVRDDSYFSMSLIVQPPIDRSFIQFVKKEHDLDVIGADQLFVVQTVLNHQNAILNFANYLFMPTLDKNKKMKSPIKPLTMPQMYIKSEGKKWNNADEFSGEYDLVKASWNMILEDATYMLNYLSILNDTSRFVVEKKHHIRSTSKKKKKKYTHSTYFVEKTRVIKNSIYASREYSESGKTLTVGHERRGHYRILRSDRFVNTQGKKIWIKPTWIGPTSYTDPKDPNKIYEVRLDL